MGVEQQRQREPEDDAPATVTAPGLSLTGPGERQPGAQRRRSRRRSVSDQAAPVEGERALRRHIPRVRLARRPAPPAAQALTGAGVGRAARLSASCSAAGSSGATRRRSAGGGDLAKAADVGEQHGLAEGQRGGQHARLVKALGPRVRQHDDIGAAKARRHLGVGNEAGHEADAGRGERLAAAPAACAAARRSTARADSIPRQAASSVSRPLYGRSRPKNRTTGPSASRSSAGSGARVGRRGEVGEGAVGDDVRPWPGPAAGRATSCAAP